jgi:hypothetical protein
MKWIFSLLLLTSIASFGQIGKGDDSTKYIRYQNQYGSRLPRLWADSVMHPPYFDTAFFKPQKPGAIMMHLDKNFYKWNGGGWAPISGGLSPSDTTNRWLNDTYMRSDSLFKYKNGAEVFVGKVGSATGDFAPLFIADTLLKPRALFVYSGESGAAGPHDTIGLSAADKAPYDRIQILNNVTKLFEPLQIGVNNNINVNFSPGYGWELELMKAMKANEVFVGDTVYLVKTARAAATIQILLDSLPTATSRIDTAIALMRKKGLYPQGYLCYSQGINNVVLNTDTATWLKSTLYYTGQERNHLGYAPIFITELLPNGALYNNTINQMPYWDGFTFVVDSAGLTFSGSHWDSLGLAKQFRRMLSLTIDTVNRRQLYTASQANVGRKGYANLSLLKVNSDIDAGGTVTANNLLRLKANLANHFIGFNAGGTSSPSGNYNTGSGFESLFSLTSGADNTANGYRSLYANNTGADNTSVGFSSLVGNTTGSGNTAIGSFSLYSNTTGNNSTAVGYGTLANANPTLGVAFGYNAMQVGTGGTGNTAVGAFSLRNVTGDYCAALGYNSLLSLTSGGYSVAVGVEALHSQTTSNHNVGVGYGVFYNNVTGARNIGMGTNAGYWSLGSSNIYIGPEAGNDNNGSRNTVIGDDAFHGPTSLSGMTILGYNVGQFATSSDELWIDNSSTTSPLLHGYFSGDSLTINGYARIRDVDSVATATGGFLFKDAITGKTKMTAAPTGTTYTFTNGLTNTSGTVSLGGTLINTTDIDNGGNLLFVHGTGEHTFRTVNGNAKFEIGTSTSSSSLSSSNSSTNLFSEINSFEGLATINAGKNGAYYNTLKLDSTGLWYIAKANVTPKTFKIDTTGQMSNDAYGSGTFTGTPAYNLQITSSGKIIEQPVASAPVVTTGTAAPATTPSKVGDIYVDTTNKKLYFATGTSSSADWTIAN